jgi:NitT/TauT family transport system substrate-binding protein
MRKSMIAAVAALGLAVSSGAASAQQTVKFTFDWAWQGPNAFGLVAQKKGYFKEEGLTVELNRGFGAGRVPIDLAAGTYQIGAGDLPTAIRFMHEKPEAGVIAIAVLFDASPLAAIVDANGPIKTPKDLEGRTLAAPDFDGGRQMFPAFAKAAGFDASKVKFNSVKPELREPMLAQGQADGITGFITSSVLSLKAIGFPESRMRIFRYREAGLPFVSNSIMTTRKFAAENPKAVQGFVRAMLRGMQDTIKDPDMAIQLLKEHEPLTDVAIEKERLMLAINELVVTQNTRANGMSALDPARLAENIRLVKTTFGLTADLKPADVYTEAFLPAPEFRAVPAVRTN